MLDGIVIYFHHVIVTFLRIVFLRKLTIACNLSILETRSPYCEYSQYEAMFHSDKNFNYDYISLYQSLFVIIISI